MTNSNINIVQKHRDSSADNDFQEMQIELQSLAEAQGKSDGLDNRPTCVNEHRVFANLVHDIVQKKLSEYAMRTQNISYVVAVKNIKENADEKKHEIQAGIARDQIKLDILEKQKERISPGQNKAQRRKLIIAFLALLAISDGVLNYPAFRNILPFYSALVVGACLSAGVFLSVPLVAGYLLKARSKKEFRIKCSIFLVAYFLIFSVLGFMRLEAATRQVFNITDPTEISVQPASSSIITLSAIILVSFGLCVVSLFTAMKHHKSEQEDLQQEEYEKKELQANKLKQSIDERLNAIRSIEANSLQAQTEARQVYEFACGHQQHLIEAGNAAFSTYSDVNRKYRTDGLCPEFLLTPPEHQYKAVFQHNA